MPPAEWHDVRNILAIRLDNIGDMVMLGPALRTLHTALPEAHITLMASPAGSQIAPLLHWVDEVIVHRPVWQDLSGAIKQSRARELELVDDLQARNFDAAFIFTSFSQSPWPPAQVCYLAGIPRRVGQSKEFGGSLLSHWIKPAPDDGHQVDRNLFLLESAGFLPAGHHLELQIPREVQAEADRLLREQGVNPETPFISLAAGASCASRRYSPDRFAECARELIKRTGMPVVLVGSQNEEELARSVLEATPGPGVVSLTGSTSVPELAAIIGRSRLLLSNHTGTMHIADALNRPMVILYSGTEYESQWRPRTAPSVLLRRPTACSPCYAFTCPYEMQCLDIPAREVVAEVEKMLEKTQEPRKEVFAYATT